jgi:hypothetical protein
MVQIRDYVRARREIPVYTDRARFLVDPATYVQYAHARLTSDRCT